MRELAPQERRRTPQRRQLLADVGRPSRVTKAVACFRSGLIRTSVTVISHGQLRVADLAAREHAGQHMADLLRHAQLPLARRFRPSGGRLPQAGTISVS